LMEIQARSWKFQFPTQPYFQSERWVQGMKEGSA
jgi:hypothetical protein